MDYAMYQDELKEYILKEETEDLLYLLETLQQDDSMTEEEYIKEDPLGKMDAILWKATYNLTWEGISVNHTFGSRYQIIDKDYIKDFLIFDPWKPEIPIFFYR